MTEYFHSQRDVDIAYDLTVGDSNAPAVIYHPGLFGSRRGPHGQMAQDLARQSGLEFLSFDNVGQGESTGRLVDHGFTGMKEIAAEIIQEKIGNDRPLILVGNSFGGATLFGVAATFQQPPAGYLGVSVVWNWNQRFRHHADRFLNTPELRQAFENGQMVNIKYPGVDGDVPVNLALFNGIAAGERANEKTSVSCPARLFHGAHDHWVSRENARQLRDHFTPMAELVGLNDNHSLRKPESLQTISTGVADFIGTILREAPMAAMRA